MSDPKAPWRPMKTPDWLLLEGGKIVRWGLPKMDLVKVRYFCREGDEKWSPAHLLKLGETWEDDRP